MEYSKCLTNDVDDKDNAAGGSGVVGQSSYRNSGISDSRGYAFSSDWFWKRSESFEMCLQSKADVAFEAELFFQQICKAQTILGIDIKVEGPNRS